MELSFIEVKETKLFTQVVQIWNGDKDDGVNLLTMMID
jgi:hypothetical protein